MDRTRQLVRAFPAILLLIASLSAWASCPVLPMADLLSAAEFASNDDLPFRFPLDEMDQLTEITPAIFCTAATMRYGPTDKYHAAEDYHLPAGTAVYAMADGKVSFSGRMGGYGWLIIVDHPQANLYSLYGHLSPSRWVTWSSGARSWSAVLWTPCWWERPLDPISTYAASWRPSNVLAT